MEGACFARYEHGGHEVLRVDQGFVVRWPGGPKVYPNARQTIMALVNQGRNSPTPTYDPNMSFDRYFRKGRYARSFQGGPDVFEIFSRPAPKPIVLGIDLARRGHEVRKLFFAGFARRVIRMGYEPEDVLQELYKALLVRNEGKCPFDPRKSSFSHYVHMVCGCVLSNYRRRYGRLERHEVFGMSNMEGEVEDVASFALKDDRANTEESSSIDSLRESIRDQVRDRARKMGLEVDLASACVDYLEEGRKIQEIASISGSPMSLVSKTVRLVRSTAREISGEMVN